MTQAIRKSVPWLCAVAVLVLSGAATAGEPNLEDQLARLRELTGDEYIAACDELLAQAGVHERLKAIRDDIADWHTKLIGEMLLYRLEHPEKARLLSKWWGGPQGLIIPGGGIAPGASLWNWSYRMVIALHFGGEAFPLVSENVLHRWTKPTSVRASALEALISLRDQRTPRVLLLVAANGKNWAGLRAHAIRRIVDCLKGLPARKIKAVEPLRAFGHWTEPKELAAYKKDRSFPELKLAGKKRTFIVQRLLPLLNDDEELVRAAAAYALQHGSGPQVVQGLAERLRQDESAWVRALCAASLRAIGTPDALAAVAKARQREGNAEVIEVIDGNRAPLKPVSGPPRGSILQARGNRGHETGDT